MKMPRVYTFDVPDFDDCGGRTTRRVEVPKAVFRQIEADVAAPLEATIHQLGENAAKAAGEYAEEVGRLRAELAIERAPKCFSCGATVRENCPRSLNAACGREHLGGIRAALTEPTDG